jgi:hypothetical protein
LSLKVKKLPGVNINIKLNQTRPLKNGASPTDRGSAYPCETVPLMFWESVKTFAFDGNVSTDAKIVH